MEIIQLNLFDEKLGLSRDGLHSWHTLVRQYCDLMGIKTQDVYGPLGGFKADPEAKAFLSRLWENYGNPLWREYEVYEAPTLPAHLRN